MREKPWTTEDPEDMPASAALLEVVELRGSGCVESEHLFLHVQIDGIDNPHPFAKHAKRWASRFSVRIVFCYFLWRGVQRRSRAAPQRSAGGGCPHFFLCRRYGGTTGG